MTIAENTAKYVGGKTMNIRFAEILDHAKPDDRTEEEIINNLKDKLRKGQ